jgi:hypothetical protein
MDLLAPVDTSPQTLLPVSDGSDTEAAMSFGWILGTQSGRPLVQNYGPSFGIPSSHCAEAWGMLSGARFLLHYTIYTRHPILEHVKVESMSDNKGLIHRATDRKTYTNVYANSTLAPDWDITEEIHKTFAQLQLMHQAFTWVKCHQDDDTSYDNLPVDAKYNVLADDLADQFMHQYGKSRMISLTSFTRCKMYATNMHHDPLRPFYQGYPASCRVANSIRVPSFQIRVVLQHSRYKPQPIITRPRIITSSNWSTTNYPLANTSRNQSHGFHPNAGTAPNPKRLTT